MPLEGTFVILEEKSILMDWLTQGLFFRRHIFSYFFKGLIIKLNETECFIGRERICKILKLSFKQYLSKDLNLDR